MLSTVGLALFVCFSFHPPSFSPFFPLPSSLTPLTGFCHALICLQPASQPVSWVCLQVQHSQGDPGSKPRAFPRGSIFTWHHRPPSPPRLGLELWWVPGEPKILQPKNRVPGELFPSVALPYRDRPVVMGQLAVPAEKKRWSVIMNLPNTDAHPPKSSLHSKEEVVQFFFSLTLSLRTDRGPRTYSNFFVVNSAFLGSWHDGKKARVIE